MTHTIYKFPITSGADNRIALSEDGFILNVQEQNGIPCVWVVTDPSAAQESHQIDVFGTGHEVDPSKYHFIGSAICGPFVWHLAIKLKEA